MHDMVCIYIYIFSLYLSRIIPASVDEAYKGHTAVSIYRIRI